MYINLILYYRVIFGQLVFRQHYIYFRFAQNCPPPIVIYMLHSSHTGCLMPSSSSAPFLIFGRNRRFDYNADSNIKQKGRRSNNVWPRCVFSNCVDWLGLICALRPSRDRRCRSSVVSPSVQGKPHGGRPGPGGAAAVSRRSPLSARDNLALDVIVRTKINCVERLRYFRWRDCRVSVLTVEISGRESSLSTGSLSA